MVAGRLHGARNALCDVYPWALRRAGMTASPGRCALPLQLPKIFSKEHLVRYLLADGRRAPDRKVADLAWTAWNLLANRLRLRTRPGSLITVGGIDGAGKSEAADAIASALDLCEVPVSRIWTRGGFSSLAARGKAVARRVAPGVLPGVADEGGKRAFLKSVFTA